ncbi:lipocalin [Arabiibacter massiliensis]|uniref:lipocalin n=1 Tax=Arabiibacter massiliensis TaxID=1870985 RepID=UPI0009BBF839|nr:lipocalin [Arabiibacter massiliensis]
MAIARLVLGVVLLVAAAVLAVQLYNGRWLFLIAEPEKAKKGTFYPEGTARTGQRASWVLVACFAVTGTLMASEMAAVLEVPAFAQTAQLLNAVALVAFCAAVVWTLFGGRTDQSFQTRFKKEGARLLILLLACCIILTAESLLFA